MKKLHISDNQKDIDDRESLKKIWVVNLSDKKLEPAVDSLLKHDLNFAISHKTLPVDDIHVVVAMEEACEKLKEDEAASLRAEVAKTVKRAKITRDVPT